MKAVIYPDRCECGSSLQFVPNADSAGGMMFTCRNPQCKSFSEWYEVVPFEAKRHNGAALFRPKLKLTG